MLPENSPDQSEPNQLMMDSCGGSAVGQSQERNYASVALYMFVKLEGLLLLIRQTKEMLRDLDSH